MNPATYNHSSPPLSPLRSLQTLMQQSGMSIIVVAWPTFLALLAAACETLSYSWMIPMVQTVISSHPEEIAKIFEPSISRFGLSLSNQTPFRIYMIGMAAIFILNLIKHALSYQFTLLNEKNIAEFGNRIRKLFYQNYLKAGKSFFDTHNFGTLNQTLMGFSNEIMMKFQNLNQFIMAVFMAIAYFLIMMNVSWKLSLLTCVMIPPLQYMFNWLVRKIQRTSNVEAQSKLNLQEKFANALFCMPLVKSYAMEEEEKKQFFILSNQVAGMQYSIAKKSVLIPPMQEIYVLMISLSIVSLMAWMTFHSQADRVAGIVVFFVVMRKFFMSLSNLQGSVAVISSLGGGIHAIQKILEESNQSEFSSGTKSLDRLQQDIEIKNLNFEYQPNQSILKNVNINIVQGKVTALVGATGSGKTTLVSLLMRFYDCSPNTIFVNGIDVRDYDPRSLRTRIAYVSQETYIFNDTIRFNLTYGLHQYSDEKIWDALRKARLDQFVLSLPQGMDAIVGDRGIMLSGGERQRLSIARAILKEAEILILDEATSSLDSVTEHLIQEAIEEAMKDKTSIVIAHRLFTLRHADMIYVLDRGNIVESGKMAELLQAKGKFCQLWETQFIHPDKNKPETV